MSKSVGSKASASRKLPAIHPGEILRVVIVPAAGLTETAIARKLGIFRQTLHDLLAERQPAAMALRPGQLFGNSAEFLLSLRRDHDLRILAMEMADEDAAIPTLGAA